MKNDQVPFERLRKVLLDLGFEEKAIPGPYLLFRHTSSGTLLPYRAYQPRDSVLWHDLVMTRKQLDARGLLDEDTFETLLHETPV
jgi:hypothetical protein